MSNASFLDTSQSISLQRGHSAALAEQQRMHSMLRTSSGAGGNVEMGRGAQGKRSGVRRQGSSGMSLETQGSLQSMLTPIQGMLLLCSILLPRVAA